MDCLSAFRQSSFCDASRDRKSTRLNSSHTVIYTLSLHDALPISGPSQLARFAHTVGVKISKQALAQRLTFVTAAWLKRVLEAAVMILVRSTPLAHGLLERFSAVIILRCLSRSEEHTSELQSHSDLHSFPTRRSSDLRTKSACSFCSYGRGQDQQTSAGSTSHLCHGSMAQAGARSRGDDPGSLNPSGSWIA